MTLILKRFEIDSPEDIVGALIDLAEIDADFNGENGEEYLWDRAKNAGYETNAEYLANLVVSKDNDFESCVKTYVDEWIGKDFYYQEYEVETLKDKNNYIVALAVRD